MLEGLVFICLKGQYLVFNKCSRRLRPKTLAPLRAPLLSPGFFFLSLAFHTTCSLSGWGLRRNLGKEVFSEGLSPLCVDMEFFCWLRMSQPEEVGVGFQGALCVPRIGWGDLCGGRLHSLEKHIRDRGGLGPFQIRFWEAVHYAEAPLESSRVP